MTTPVAKPSENFYDRAERRITIFLAALGCAVTPLLVLLYGSKAGVGFLAGVAISSLNLFWLKQAVALITDRMAKPAFARGSAPVLAHFLFRYALLGVGTYVILQSATLSALGFVLGLFLPIAAFTCEAAYEAYAAFRRRI